MRKCYENYPAWIVFVSNVISLSTYVIGGFLMYQIGFFWLVAYILYVFILEIRLISRHCIHCYYFGKTCAFGKGRVSSLFFNKGRGMDFMQHHMTWKDIVPDFLVSVVPIIAGIVTLIMHFSWITLLCVILLFILGFFGSAFVRTRLACKFCKQRELGCPAEQLFKKPHKR